MFRAGDRIGSYILVERIGKGAFGAVWLAEEHTALSTHKVALKLPNDEDVDLDAIRKEAAVWESIKGHPNVLPIIKADIVDGQIYIASEYVPDGTLLKWLNKHGGKAPSIESAREMTCGILAGLEHLHSKNVVHRDLKPANILLQSNTPRLADFGLARILKNTTQSLTVSGTYAYMPPEAFRGRRSEKTDLWSVGVILYQLLSGRLPFPQKEHSNLIAAILNDEPESLPETVPEWLRQTVNKAMRKDPQKRWRSATEMRQALINQIFEETADQEQTIDDGETIDNEETVDNGAIFLPETIDAELFLKNKQQSDLEVDNENQAKINGEVQKIKIAFDDVLLKKESAEEPEKENSDGTPLKLVKDENKNSKVPLSTFNQNKKSGLGFIGVLAVIGAITIYSRLSPTPSNVDLTNLNTGFNWNSNITGLTNTGKNVSLANLITNQSLTNRLKISPTPFSNSSLNSSINTNSSSIDKTGKFPARIGSFTLKQSENTNASIFTLKDYQAIYEKGSQRVTFIIFNADSSKAETLFKGNVSRYQMQTSAYQVLRLEENISHKIVVATFFNRGYFADILKNQKLYKISTFSDLLTLNEFIEAFNQQF